MRRLALIASLVILVALAQTAWAVVEIDWVDAARGPEAAPVEFTLDDIDPGDPLYVGDPYGWLVTIDVYADNAHNPITFTVTGDMRAPGGTYAYRHLRIQQYVWNWTNSNWTAFNIDLTGADFEQLWGEQTAWTVETTSAYAHFTMVPENYDAGPIEPNQYFADGLYINEPGAGPIADFTFTKEFLPEPASLSVLLAGIAGAALIRRRAR